MKSVAIIPAAGSGKRLPGDVSKQFLSLEGKPILVHTLEKFQNAPSIDGIFLVTSENQIPFVREHIVEKYDFSHVTKILAGGRERQDSVYKGLRAIPASAEIVVVHDGVRPFISVEKIQQLIEYCQLHEAVILAVRPKDTVKTDIDGTVGGTLDRNKLWLAQTPQVFKYSIIKTAFDKAYADGYYGTDEASLVERVGKPVTVLEGDYKNIKITTPEDLAIAKMILNK